MNAAEELLGEGALARHGARTALICGDMRLTYADLAQQVCRAANAFAELYEAAKDRRVFHLDDVYVTGLLRQRACLNLIDSSSPFQIFVNILYRMGTGICSVFYFDQFS